MHKHQVAFLPFILAIGLSSCTTAAPSQAVGESREMVSGVPTAERETPTSFHPTETEIVPTPTPDWDKLWVPSSFPGEHVLILEVNQPYSYELPFQIGKFYDYSPVNHCILFAIDFPDHGAGPRPVSVSDLTISDLDNGQIDTLIVDDIVEALWFPDGETFAYIQATDQTYELHRRSFDGIDQILAKDVTFKWSIAPSGQAVAFTRESGYEIDIAPGLYIVDLDSGEERMVADVDLQGAGSVTDRPFWSPDSSEVILSYWAGPEEPRLILARVDGTASFDLVIDPKLVDEWWATIRIPKIVWYPDGDHLVGTSAIIYELDGPDALVYYRIDRNTNTLVDGKLLANVSDYENLIGWAEPGVSVWAFVIGVGLTEVFVP